MTVHFFTKGDEGTADSRQRGIRIAQELSSRGYPTIVHVPPVMFISRTHWPYKGVLIVQILRALPKIKRGDVIFLQRTISNKYFFGIIVAYIWLFGRKMIFDFDDAIYLHDSFKTKTLTRMADAVIVCSQTLKQWAEQYNSNVHVIHTTLKLADYEPWTKDYSHHEGPVVLGWIGTIKDHRQNLALLARVLSQLCIRTDIPIKLVLVGERSHSDVEELFTKIPKLQVEFRSYVDAKAVPATLQSFDIGLNPLAAKSEWNLARSSYKPYEYMACGLAQVTSAVGEITRVVKDGVNGYCADSDEEWVEKLLTLVGDLKLCTRLGKAGQETMRREEAFEAIIPRFIQIIESCTNKAAL